jgi:hypothetical protein
MKSLKYQTERKVPKIKTKIKLEIISCVRCHAKEDEWQGLWKDGDR